MWARGSVSESGRVSVRACVRVSAGERGRVSVGE